MENIKDRISEEIKSIIKKSEGKLETQDFLELVSLSKQSAVKPVHFCIDDEEVVEKYEGDTFCIYITNYYAHFMTRGGYHIFAKPSYVSLYGTIKSMLDYLNGNVKGLDDKNKSDFGILVEASTVMMEAPMFVFGDTSLMLDIAILIQKRLNEKLLESENAELQKDEPEKNEAYRDAVESAEMLSEELPKIAKKVRSKKN